MGRPQPRDKLVTPMMPITRTVITKISTMMTAMTKLVMAVKGTTMRRKFTLIYQSLLKPVLTSAVATTMPMHPTHTTKMVATTKATKGTKMAITMTSTMSKELLASNHTKAKVEDGPMTRRKIRRPSATSP